MNWRARSVAGVRAGTASHTADVSRYRSPATISSMPSMKKFLVITLFLASMYGSFRLGYARGRNEVQPYLFDWAFKTGNFPQLEIGHGFYAQDVCAVIEGRKPRNQQVIEYR